MTQRIQTRQAAQAKQVAQRTLGTVGVMLAVTLAVGLITNDGWPGYVVGAVLAGALWMMLFFGELSASVADARVPLSVYAPAAALSVVFGGLLYWIGNHNATFWGVGSIMAGILWPTYERARADDGGS